MVFEPTRSKNKNLQHKRNQLNLSTFIYTKILVTNAVQFCSYIDRATFSGSLSSFRLGGKIGGYMCFDRFQT